NRRDENHIPPYESHINSEAISFKIIQKIFPKGCYLFFNTLMVKIFLVRRRLLIFRGGGN
ncbi:MAG: hypothetical protein SVO01_11885, partial [Thermotogota bacterium]|nr:hypothetical protein [Thermotogota bacterium]